MTFKTRGKPGRTVLLLAILLVAQSVRTESVLAADIDTSTLRLKIEVAFPNVKWPLWAGGEATGVVNPLRPILVGNAGDGSNRVFIPTQQGVIYVLRNDRRTADAKVFLDLREKVSYDDKANEEGFLGLAFHPRYRENGYFFVYYTNRAKKHQNILARYRVDQNDPNRADPGSEQILITFDKPFANHDGGTIVFGRDGYLYIAVGDGGAGADPFGNGQNLSTLFGKVLRIDVNRADHGHPYAIPADNPFADRRDARPEIWAYGLRNVWRMAFDRKTDVLWAGDVGEDTWEEIDLIVKGGNYGWNLREGRHPFVKKGATPPIDASRRADLIDPIWEYDHNVGKAIIGGLVYRGEKIPELDGAYLYADYVLCKLWALRYDAAGKRVTANRSIPLPWNIPIMSFGEDEQGEVYFTTAAQNGKGVYRISRPD